MNVPVCTVYLQILVIFSLLVGIMLYREPPTPLGDGDGRAVARGAGPQDVVELQSVTVCLLLSAGL